MYSKVWASTVGAPLSEEEKRPGIRSPKSDLVSSVFLSRTARTAVLQPPRGFQSIAIATLRTASQAKKHAYASTASHVAQSDWRGGESRNPQQVEFRENTAVSTWTLIACGHTTGRPYSKRTWQHELVPRHFLLAAPRVCTNATPVGDSGSETTDNRPRSWSTTQAA